MAHRCISVACSKAAAVQSRPQRTELINTDESLVAAEVLLCLLSSQSGTSAAWSQAGLSPAALQTVGLSAGRGHMSPLFTGFRRNQLKILQRDPQCYFTPAYLPDHLAAVCVPHKGT